ncbi:MAG: hypothetical protein ACLGH0_11870, partial [Thermoanaerobaculia bacterium]
MRFLAALVLVAFAYGATGSQPVERASDDGLRARDSISLAQHESRSMNIFGATAAWAIDASIVDVSASNGTVTFFGRTPGQTKVIVVSISGERTFDVAVIGKTPIRKQETKANSGTAEVRYSSAMREVQNQVTVTSEDKKKKTELSVRTIHRPESSVPSASYRIFTRGREITLLDRDVDHSPLTLSNTPIRGLHYLDKHWRVHAGYTAYATYRSFLIPIDRQLVAGAGYAFRTGAAKLTPSVFAYRGQGSIASLLYEQKGAAIELAYSNGLGGAVQYAYDSPRDRLRADFRYRPDDFAVTAGTSRGFFGDASWSREYARGSNASFVFAASDFA